MTVIINADASLCSQTKTGGYGFYIEHANGNLEGSGVLKQGIDGTNIAEMMALMNALWTAINNNLIPIGGRVILRTDSKGAIFAFTNKVKPNASDEMKQLVEWFITIEKYNRLQISFQHVKAHTKRKSRRYIINRVCDALAKANMQLARLKLTEK